VLEAVGVAHVVTVDLHTPQMEGFFHVPVDTLTAVPALCRALRGRLPPDVVVVSPDAGRVQLAMHYAHCLGAPVGVLHKRRDDGTHPAVTHAVGDVGDRACLIVDDMISTGGTIAAGARPEITVAATHGLLLPGARARLEHPAVREVMITDSVAPAGPAWPGLRAVSIAPLIAGALQRFLANGSLGDLY